MKTMSAIVCAAVSLIGLTWVTNADEARSRSREQRAQTGVAVESLLPGNAIFALTYDGTERHIPAIRETAAWKSFDDTGLNARFLDILQTFSSAAGPELGQLARDVVEHLRGHGLSAAASLSGSGSGLAPYGVVVFHDAASLAERISPHLQRLLDAEHAIVEATEISGRAVTRIQSPQPGLEVGWWTEGDHLVAAIGTNACEQVIATATRKSPGIASHPLWKTLRTSSTYTVDSFAWFDLGSLLTQFGDEEIPPARQGGEPVSIRELASILGLDNLKTVTFQSGFKGAATWNDVRIEASGPLNGLAALMQQRVLPLDQLPPMPKATTGFLAATFDAATAWDTSIETIRNVFRRIDPQSEADMDETLAGLPQMLGFDLRADLIGSLGDVWCGFADTAALPIPIGFAPVAAVSVKDRAKLTSSLAQIGTIVQQQAGTQSFTIKQAEKDGRTYFSINLSGMPFVPTILVTDSWMVASLTPASAQSFVQRENGKLPSWKPDGEVAEALAQLPKEFSSITVSDPAPGYQQLMLLAPMGLNLLQQEALPQIGDGSLQLPFGVEDIPAVELITEPMFPNVTVGFNTPSGVGSSSRHSVPSNPLGNISGGATVPILIALLLPAVQQAREAARRTQSRNNLKQLALALHNYHDVYGYFPRGTVENDDLKPEERLSWIYSIMPYVEEAALYNQLSATTGWQSDENSIGVQTALIVMRNPSQIAQRENPSSGDYVGIAGIGPDAALLANDDPKAGIFGYNRTTRFADITDGTSNTLMIGDAYTPGMSFLAGGPSTIRGFSQSPYLNGPDGIGSPHRGIVQFALADGSVRAISVEIDETILEALATKAGGEVVADF